MSIGIWEVIESECGERFACQRATITGDEELETSVWLNSEGEAYALCDLLNAEHELAELSAR